MSKTYKVEVVEIATNKVMAVIGHRLSAAAAERRVLTGLSRYNPDKVFVRDVSEAHCGREVAGHLCHDKCPLKKRGE